jgi:HTH-type transcriptional regulator/antitoxin MqsA
MTMAKNPRNYPDAMPSPESGRPMIRGEKLVALTVEGQTFEYLQPGWWCSLDDPADLDGQLVDDDNLVAEMARRTAEAIVKGELFTPLAIRAIRVRCGLTQRDAGEIFGTGEKSFEKYEAGQIRPSKPTKRLLKLAMERPDLFGKSSLGAKIATTASDAALIQETIRAAHLDRLYAPLFRNSPPPPTSAKPTDGVINQ